MRVTLFDHRTGGHHVQHVNFLARYLLEAGDHVTFVTVASERDVVDRLVDHSRFDVAFVDGGRGGSLPRRTIGHLRALDGCFDHPAAREADVVHVMDLNRLEPAMLATAHWNRGALASTSLVGTLVAPYFFPDPEAGVPSRLYKRFNRWALGRLLSRGSLAHLFVLSEPTRERLAAEYPGAADRITVVPDPIAEFDADRTRAQAREALGLPQDRPVVLFFGRLRHEKGPDVLLEALERLESDPVCVFAGPPGAVGSDDIARARERLPDGVEIIDRLQFVPDERMPDYFHSATLVVLPYRESYAGTSGVLQHAAAARRPVVAADAPQLGSIVREWELGTTVPPNAPDALANAIDEWLAGGNRSEAVAARAESYTDHHHWRRWARQIRETYSSLVTE